MNVTPEEAREAATIAHRKILETITIIPCVVRARGYHWEGYAVMSPAFPESYYGVFPDLSSAKSAIIKITTLMQSEEMDVDKLTKEVLRRAQEEDI